jgi:hypothetical protein
MPVGAGLLLSNMPEPGILPRFERDNRHKQKTLPVVERVFSA